MVGSEFRTELFQKLCNVLPGLQELETDVIRLTNFFRLEDPRPTTQHDTDVFWYTLFKPRLVKLVGWEAEDDSDLVGTEEAYDTASRYLYRALSPSKETLGEASTVDEYQRNLDEQREFWDGNEETEPDVITTRQLMKIAVDLLGLPKTEAYLDYMGNRG